MGRRATTGRFANLPIARKALILAMVPTVIAILVVGVASLAVSYLLARQNLARELDAQSRVLADTLSAAVAFDDRQVATQTVSAMRTHWRIDAVCVYDEAGQLFVSNTNPGVECTRSRSPDAAIAFPSIQRPILVGDRKRGDVLITGNLNNVVAFTQVEVLVTLIALLVAFGMAIILTRRLRTAVAEPMVVLANTAEQIASSGDYSLRASSLTDDEVGHLGRSFNTMLSVIERTDGERRSAERALRASEARWRAIIDSATDAVIVIDHRGHIEAFNPGAERLFGYREAEVLTAKVGILMPAPYRDEHDGYLARYRATGIAKIIGAGRDVTGLHKDGTTFPLRLSVGEMSVDGEQKFVGILHDLTERVAMETRLRDQAALSKLGEMAAVIAHEVKNPIAGVRGAIQIIGSRLPPGSKDALIVNEIVARLDTLNDLMKDLLLFARPREPRLAAVDLATLVQGVADLVSRDAGHAHLEIDIQGSVPAIQADGELLKIAVQNFVINSAHAMNGRGRIDVALTSDGASCQIAIADGGPGIPAEVRARLFTPFITTKARGTGLGLATAKRFVEAHRGTVTVDCPPRGGTTITIQLPVRAS